MPPTVSFKQLRFISRHGAFSPALRIVQVRYSAPHPRHFHLCDRCAGGHSLRPLASLSPEDQRTRLSSEVAENPVFRERALISSMVMPMIPTQRRGLRANHFIAAGIRTTATAVSQITDGGVLRRDHAALEVDLAV
jgi:hypothetical protein